MNNLMKLYKKIILGGAILTGLAGLFAGCKISIKDSPSSRDIPKEERSSYSTIGNFQMYTQTGIAMTSGDFDNDGEGNFSE